MRCSSRQRDGHQPLKDCDPFVAGIKGMHGLRDPQFKVTANCQVCQNPPQDTCILLLNCPDRVLSSKKPCPSYRSLENGGQNWVEKAAGSSTPGTSIHPMPRHFSGSVSREICHCCKQRITTLVCSEVVVEDLRPDLKEKKTIKTRIFNSSYLLE